MHFPAFVSHFFLLLIMQRYSIINLIESMLPWYFCYFWLLILNASVKCGWNKQYFSENGGSSPMMVIRDYEFDADQTFHDSF